MKQIVFNLIYFTFSVAGRGGAGLSTHTWNKFERKERELREISVSTAQEITWNTWDVMRKFSDPKQTWKGFRYDFYSACLRYFLSQCSESEARLELWFFDDTVNVWGAWVLVTTSLLGVLITSVAFFGDLTRNLGHHTQRSACVFSFACDYD